MELADTGSDFVDAPGVDEFAEQTETQNLTFSIAEAGEYTIGFGLVDVGDEIFDSGLVIDNIQQIPLALFDSSQGLSGDSDGAGVNLVFGANGLVSPTELGNLPPDLAEILATSQVGQISPVSHGEWQMIVRLEKAIPAQLDRAMHQRLLNELFELWLSQQLSQLPCTV